MWNIEETGDMYLEQTHPFYNIKYPWFNSQVSQHINTEAPKRQ